MIVCGPPFEADPLRNRLSRPAGSPQGHAARPSRQRQGGCASGSANSAVVLDRGSPRQYWHRASPACRDRETDRVTEHGAGDYRAGRSVRHGDEGQVRRPGQTFTGDRGARRRGSATVARGIAFAHIRTNPVLCRLCSGPPAFAVNPRWGYARQKFRKIRFRFFVAGQALSFPQAGPWKVRPARFGK